MARSRKSGGSASGVSLSPPKVGRTIPVAVVKPPPVHWTDCTLADGTVLRIALLVNEVSRAADRFNAAGEPIYVLKTNLVVNATVPKKLMKKAKER